MLDNLYWIYKMVTAFFYGLFLDPEILVKLGYTPNNVQIAKLNNYQLIIGERANLIRSDSNHVWGNLIDLSQNDINALYSEKSVADYKKQTVSCIAQRDNKTVTADVYILPEGYAMKPAENSDYTKKLYSICQKYNFPDDYLNHLNRMIDEIGDQKC